MQIDLLPDIAKERVVCEADRIEVLRQILTSEQGTIVSYEEAIEVGESLVEFYKALSETDRDE